MTPTPTPFAARQIADVLQAWLAGTQAPPRVRELVEGEVRRLVVLGAVKLCVHCLLPRDRHVFRVHAGRPGVSGPFCSFGGDQQFEAEASR